MYNAASDVIIGGESCATPQTFAIKVQFDDDIRRFTLPELSWEPLRQKTGEVFKRPAGRIVLKYKDEEGDLITVTSSEDLLDAAKHSAQPNSLRLFASLKGKRVPAVGAAPKAAADSSTASDESPKSVEPTTTAPVETTLLPQSPLKEEDAFQVPSSADFKEKRKILKEQRKLLKELKRDDKLQLKQDFKRRVKGCKRAKADAKHDGGGRCPFKGMTPEERAAYRAEMRERREARRAAFARDALTAPSPAPAPAVPSSDDSSSKKEEVAAVPAAAATAPEPQAAAQVTIADLLRKLKAMGFSDVGRNLQLLQKLNGDFDATVAALTA